MGAIFRLLKPIMRTTIPDVLLRIPNKISNLIAAVGGSLITLSFAPFNYWFVGIFSLACLALLIHQQPLKTILWRSWFFGAGMYASGVSWVYVSISGFGGAPAPLAILLVALFVNVLAFAFIIPFYIYGKFFSHSAMNLLVAFPITWLLSEWIRTWLLTGFPWLFIGYAHTHTWISGWAPIVGVMGLSFICALSAGFLAQCCWAIKKFALLIGGTVTFLFWMGGLALQQYQWTHLSPNPISLAMVQPNIAQENKWEKDCILSTMSLLKEKSEPLWGNKIIIWPEAAVTALYSDALPFLNEMNSIASEHNSGLITGIIFDDAEKNAYYNSIATFGDAIGIYHKRRLVPFGEYVPREWLRNLITFFNLPTSHINLGPQDQHGLKSGDIYIAPSICYEVAYPDLVAKSAVNSQLLMSISNLGWFGDSLGRHQFLQMAQMRAVETQRYFAYSTNNGPSAIIDSKGNVKTQSTAFTQTTLVGEVYAANGTTPFMRWGSWPLIIASLILLLIVIVAHKKSAHSKMLTSSLL